MYKIVYLSIIASCYSKTNVLNIFMTGDWGGPRQNLSEDATVPAQNQYGYSISHSMNILAEEIAPDSILFLGDNIYAAGVQNVVDERFNDTYLSTFERSNLKNIPMYAIAGNHEYNRNVSALIEYSKIDPTGRWNYPDYWYSISYLEGRVLQLMIDTLALTGEKPWIYDYDYRTEEDWSDKEKPEYEWIIETLESNPQAEVVIFSTHYPMYSAGKYGSDEELYSKLGPILEKYGVSGYFSGHDHISEHTTSNYNGPSFTDFFVIGQGKKPDSKSYVGNCLHCDLVWWWDYPPNCLGAWGLLQVFEGDQGKLHPEFSFVDAQTNRKIYKVELKSRK